MRFARAIGIVRKRAPLYLSAKILLSLLFLVSAASITISTTPLQAEHGGAISFSNNLVAADRGISRSTSGTADAGSSCGPSGNVTFTTGTIQQANIGLVVNDFVYSIQANTTTLTPNNSCFTVTLTIIASGNTNTYVLHLATSATVVADQAVNCIFDIGSTLPASPYSFSVAVQ
jgi:hypothetical protein